MPITETPAKLWFETDQERVFAIEFIEYNVNNIERL